MFVKEEQIRDKYRKIESFFGRFNHSQSVAMLYHENSKLSEISSREFGLKVASFNNPYYLERASRPYKIYSGKKVVDLKRYKNSELPNKNFFEIMLKRKSTRHYKKTKITLRDLYHLSHYTYGITREEPIIGVDDKFWQCRFVPSAGGLYPLEIYFIILNGTISKGLYHYRPDRSVLETLNENDYLEMLDKITSARPYVDLNNASCVMLVTSVFERMLIKYGDRGYRFILEEVGSVSQNISLVCEAIGWGSCMIGGFMDDKIHELLDINSLAEAIQNVIVIGKEAKQS